MKFEKLALIGCGLMGGSFALALKQAQLVRHVTGFSASEATRQKAFAFRVYEGAAHAFHNDTGAAYNADAACAAWAETITFFNKWLRAPRP